MNEVDDDKIKILIHKLGLKYNLQDKIIKKIVNSPYKFTRETITNLDFSGIETEEDYNKFKTNFIYLYIGKIYTSYNILMKFRNQRNRLEEFNKKEEWKKK